MSQLHYIDINKIESHPDNPRKDLGDLTELAESIKINGILQNLTIVPWFSSITYAPLDDPEKQAEAGYRVVIGHRRLAAAKLAGIADVPCIISDMNLQDQVRTMLMENIQRSDLSVYEQAQGFQMMLNLGDSVDDISQKTGFSESTVRRRVKLLELDSEKFKKSVERGASLQSYAELEQIKDIELRNSVLEKVGTSNFNYALSQAIAKEKQDATLAILIEKVSEFATQAFDETGYRHLRSYSSYDKPKEIEIPSNIDTVTYFFFVTNYGYIRLLTEKSDTSILDNATLEREQKEKERKELTGKLSKISETSYELRKKFVKSLSTKTIKKNLATIIFSSVYERTVGYTSFDEMEFLKLLDVDYSTENDKDDDIHDAKLKETISTTVFASPERAILATTYCDFDDSTHNTYFDYYGQHEENEELDRLYHLLEKLGYELSDEELSMKSGTHKLLMPKESDS